MYQPTLGRFLSRDPLSENGVAVLTDTGFYSDRLAAMSADPWFYGGNWEHPYVYARNNPTRYTDPSGLKCQIAVHCSPVVRLGITLGKHCGLNISDNQGSTTLDGSGGGTNQILLGENYGNVGPYRDFPDSVCSCLRSYVAKFNAQKIPRTHTQGNSNWTLYCMVSHCGLWINWHGASPPIGYEPNGACSSYKYVCDVEPPGLSVCVSYYQCP
jgi:hypothetical protein